eukprot:scaffold5176_cov298-Prasinococcus_capsulatus_cf.AAC.1
MQCARLGEEGGAPRSVIFPQVRGVALRRAPPSRVARGGMMMVAALTLAPRPCRGAGGPQAGERRAVLRARLRAARRRRGARFISDGPKHHQQRRRRRRRGGRR